jgi:hypothetical protein
VSSSSHDIPSCRCARCSQHFPLTGAAHGFGSTVSVRLALLVTCVPMYGLSRPRVALRCVCPLPGITGMALGPHPTPVVVRDNAGSPRGRALQSGAWFSLRGRARRSSGPSCRVRRSPYFSRRVRLDLRLSHRARQSLRPRGRSRRGRTLAVG